jgi:hypothetical protein
MKNKKVTVQNIKPRIELKIELGPEVPVCTGAQSFFEFKNPSIKRSVPYKTPSL